MTTVTVELLSGPHRRHWRDIPDGEIFIGDGKVAPVDYPPGRATGEYGAKGTWIKINGGLYHFESGSFWPTLAENSWFEGYHAFKSVKFVEGP